MYFPINCIHMYSRTSLIRNLDNPNTTFKDIHMHFSVFYIEYS